MKKFLLLLLTCGVFSTNIFPSLLYSQVPPAPILYCSNSPVPGPRVKFMWHRVTNATSYRLQISTDTTFSTVIIDTSGITDTTVTLTIWQGCWYWHVRAWNSFGWGPSSAVCIVCVYMPFEFYPMKVGNYWVYNEVCLCPTPIIYRYWVKVIDSLITNGHKYYKVRTGRPGSPTSDEYLRVDTLAGNIRKYVTSGSCPWLINEKERDSLSARFRDSSRYECTGPFWRCTNDSSYMNICGMNRRKKVYEWSNYFEGWGQRTFVRDMGLYRDYTQGPGWSIDITLRGSIINGVLCGDTSLTGINIISTEVPEKFTLYQNYPNPFNSNSKIRFDVSSNRTLSGAKGLNIKLIIYDVRGREAATLVDQQLNPGTYEAEWDASNYPSGVYFYKLTAGDFSETKKMVLLK